MTMRPFRHSALLLLALLGVCLSAPSAGQAAAPWSSPLLLAGSQAVAPQLVLTAGGSGLVAYSVPAPAGGPPATARLVGAVTRHGITFEPVADLGALNLTKLATYGSNRLVAVGTTGSRHPRPAVAFGRPGEPFAPARAVDPDGGDGRVLAADTNARGDIAVVVGRCERATSCSAPVPHLVLRRAGEPFGKPVRLAVRGPVRVAAVRLNARGDVVTAFARPVAGKAGVRTLYARTMTLGGKLLPVRHLSSAASDVHLSLTLDERRRAVVAWQSQRMVGSAALGPSVVAAAISTDGDSFARPLELESVAVTGTGRRVAEPGVEVVGTAEGAETITWTGFQNGRFVVRAARVVAGRIGAPQLLSALGQNTVLADVAVSPRDGAVTVVGRQGVAGELPDPIETPIMLVAAVRPAGATAFGRAERITDVGGSIFTPTVEIDARSGRALTVWQDPGAGSLMSAVRAPQGTG